MSNPVVFSNPRWNLSNAGQRLVNLDRRVSKNHNSYKRTCKASDVQCNCSPFTDECPADSRPAADCRPSSPGTLFSVTTPRTGHPFGQHSPASVPSLAKLRRSPAFKAARGGCDAWTTRPVYLSTLCPCHPFRSTSSLSAASPLRRRNGEPRRGSSPVEAGAQRHDDPHVPHCAPQPVAV